MFVFIQTTLPKMPPKAFNINSEQVKRVIRAICRDNKWKKGKVYVPPCAKAAAAVSKKGTMKKPSLPTDVITTGRRAKGNGLFYYNTRTKQFVSKAAYDASTGATQVPAQVVGAPALSPTEDDWMVPYPGSQVYSDKSW